ncbi:FMN-binding protein [Microbacterium esteraromaticum]|uniref:FMN-binding protein n=1 Tax=Microbacterium esteraromaticum TaxID=57043 RepID=A0A939DZ13_9MICO|nr:FMN-binding protein [Microbacterium esteraromaticum]MBN7794846.1 FMN-binding protein [Microbacterium esteraromaticum]MBN8206929.1 FMN-binding protein [Microbacterium esteraromaticum]MBN8417084.1 FMN-binding protein [Microbacterium esteraromaticum]MCA1307470.1 FMN-binding protein [Microbacterium esteraromaticum]
MNAHHAARTGTALLGAAGVLLLSGCAGGGAADAGDPSPVSTDATAPYADGTYTAEGAYQTPETVENISVTLTLSDDVVTDVEVVGDPTAPESTRYQGQFIDGIAAEVVGKKLDELDVDRVAGSSLTSGGFNQALVRIKEEAVISAADNGDADTETE